MPTMKMPHCVSWGWHQSLGSASPNSLTNGALPQAFNGPVRQMGHGEKGDTLTAAPIRKYSGGTSSWETSISFQEATRLPSATVFSLSGRSPRENSNFSRGPLSQRVGLQGLLWRWGPSIKG